MGAFMAAVTGSEGRRLQPIEERESYGGDRWGSMTWEEDGVAACEEEAALGQCGQRRKKGPGCAMWAERLNRLAGG
jgi:hypothetical protein